VWAVAVADMFTRSVQKQPSSTGGGGGGVAAVAAVGLRARVPAARGRSTAPSGSASTTADGDQPWKGVYPAGRGKWCAQWFDDGQKHHIGSFPSAAAASEAYDKEERARAAKQGRPAVVNHPCNGTEVQARKGGHENKLQPVTGVRDKRGYVEPEEGAKKRAEFVGVYWEKDMGLWYAQIYEKDSQRSLGFFNDPEEAAKAYDAAARKRAATTGKKVRLNFPTSLCRSGALRTGAVFLLIRASHSSTSPTIN
jgi:hypothetical protein